MCAEIEREYEREIGREIEQRMCERIRQIKFAEKRETVRESE